MSEREIEVINELQRELHRVLKIVDQLNAEIYHTKRSFLSATKDARLQYLIEVGQLKDELGKTKEELLKLRSEK